MKQAISSVFSILTSYWMAQKTHPQPNTEPEKVHAPFISRPVSGTDDQSRLPPSKNHPTFEINRLQDNYRQNPYIYRKFVFFSGIIRKDNHQRSRYFIITS